MRNMFARHCSFLFLILCSVFACGLPLPTMVAETEGSVAEAKKLHDAGEYQRAFSMLKALFRADPSAQDVNFQLARTAVALGEHEYAATTLGRMLDADPSLHRVRLELGRVYLLLRSYAMAESCFTAVLDAKDTPPDVRANVEPLLEKIRTAHTESKRRFSHNYSLALEIAWDSNVDSAPLGSTSVDLGGGQTTPLNGVDIEQDMYAAIYGKANMRYQPYEAAYGFTGGILGGQVLYFDRSDLDISIGRIEGGAFRRFGALLLNVKAFGMLVDWDYQDFLKTVGAKASVSYEATEWALVGVEYVAEYREYHDLSYGRDDGSGIRIDERAGYSGHYGQIHLKSAVRALGTTLFSSLGYEFADTRETIWSYDRLAIELKLARTLSEKWDVSGDCYWKYDETLYDGPGAYAFRRRDKRHILGCAVNKGFKTNVWRDEYWRVGLFYEYWKCNSSFEIYEYNKHVVGMRLLVDF